MSKRLKKMRSEWNESQWNHWDNLTTEEREEQEKKYEEKLNSRKMTFFNDH